MIINSAGSKKWSKPKHPFRERGERKEEKLLIEQRRIYLSKRGRTNLSLSLSPSPPNSPLSILEIYCSRRKSLYLMNRGSPSVLQTPGKPWPHSTRAGLNRPGSRRGAFSHTPLRESGSIARPSIDYPQWTSPRRPLPLLAAWQSIRWQSIVFPPLSPRQSTQSRSSRA